MRTTTFDADRLAELAAGRRQEYAEARPFPHVVIDGFAPESAVDDVLAEFPSAEEESWFRFDGEKERKLASTDDRMMGAATAALLAELNGATFINFLHELTGIEGLIPDPHFHGGGLHQIEPGGFLEVHVDFNLHPLTHLERRLNLLLYLNRDWQSGWGGELELWGPGMKRCEAKIEPVFNRCVIFTTTDTSYHGHPAPLTCPPGVTRKSMALYYYSVPTSDRTDVHNTLFRDTNRGSERATRVLKEFLPPVVAKGAGRARRAWRERTRS